MTTTEIGTRTDRGGGPAGASSPRREAVPIWLGIVALDAVGSVAAWSLALALAPVAVSVASAACLIAIATATTVLSVATKGLYREYVHRIRAVETSGVVRSSAVGAVAVGLLDDRLTSDLGLRWPLIGAALGATTMIGARATAHAALRAARRRGHLQRRVLLVGESESAAHLADELTRRPGEGYLVVGAVGDELAHRVHSVAAPHLGTLDDLEDAVARSAADWAIVTPSGLGRKDATEVIRRLMVAGVTVELAGSLGLHHRRLRPTAIGRETAFHVERVDLTGPQRILKRAIDVAGAAVALVVLSPVLAVAALALRLSDGGPVLFRQQRVGRGGVPFTMFKLRSMVVGAEDQLAALQARNQRPGPMFKLVDDPRITRVGRLLRATSLDEVPQLWNVLRGEMSLVGPRPALPSEAVSFGDDLNRRHSVRPGITGLWQIESRDSDRFTDVERHDLFYVENWSVLLDLGLLARTLGHVVARAWRSLRRDSEVMV